MKKSNLIKIENDCCCICDRIKDVDPSYEIYFNIDNCSYEVHTKEEDVNTYCFKIPYSQLDGRTIDFAYKTRISNIDELIAEMDKNNDLLYEKNIKQQVNSIKEAICL